MSEPGIQRYALVVDDLGTRLVEDRNGNLLLLADHVRVVELCEKQIEIEQNSVKDVHQTNKVLAEANRDLQRQLATARAEVWAQVVEKARQADNDSADPRWILEWAEQQAQQAREK